MGRREGTGEGEGTMKAMALEPCGEVVSPSREGQQRLGSSGG